MIIGILCLKFENKCFEKTEKKMLKMGVCHSIEKGAHIYWKCRYNVTETKKRNK